MDTVTVCRGTFPSLTVTGIAFPSLYLGFFHCRCIHGKLGVVAIATKKLPRQKKHLDVEISTLIRGYCHVLPWQNWSLVLVYVLNPGEFDFFIAERVRLFWICFINSIISLVIYCRNGSDYYLTLLYIACLFNDGVLRTVTHYECFPIKGIDVWLFIQCWDNRQSLVIHSLGLSLIFFIISENFTYKLLCNW